MSYCDFVAFFNEKLERGRLGFYAPSDVSASSRGVLSQGA